jgi:hypothetical protein
MIPKSSSSRWLAGTTVAVVAIAVISIIVALGTGSSIVTLDEGSPEAAVQDFMLAIDDRDLDAAYALRHPDARVECSLDQFRRQLPRVQDSNRDMRIRLSSVHETPNSAEVTVEITQFSPPDLFEPDFVLRDGTYVATFVVRDIDGEWRIVSAPWPYQSCAFARRVLLPTPTPKPTPTPTMTPDEKA